MVGVVGVVGVDVGVDGEAGGFVVDGAGLVVGWLTLWALLLSPQPKNVMANNNENTNNPAITYCLFMGLL